MRTISTLTVVTHFWEIDDVFFVVGEAVGVEALADGWVSGVALFVLVEDGFNHGVAAACETEGEQLEVRFDLNQDRSRPRV